MHGYDIKALNSPHIASDTTHVHAELAGKLNPFINYFHVPTIGNLLLLAGN